MRRDHPMEFTEMTIPTRPRVLMIDDTRENLMLLRALLGSNYQCMAATDGRQGLELAHADDPPDLILLDVMMPGMDGWEVCRRLKTDAKTREIPVIFLTGLTHVHDEVRGFGLGAGQSHLFSRVQ
jgi:putative two-component system response regulator